MRISDWSSDVCSSDLQVREGRAMDKREDPLPPKDDIITDDRERGADPDPRESDTELDEDDRLRPEFVTYVVTLANAGEHEAARERVGRLHPADIADLFELLSDEDRPLFASVLGDLMSPDVLAEKIGRAHVCTPVPTA